jgi:hypothetical protein
LWKLDQLKKEERERIEAQEKKKLVNNTMTVLDWQKDTRSIIKQSEQGLVQDERSMLKN